MSQLFAFILISLATWRVAHFVVAEDGPFDVVVKMRARAGDSWVGQLMDCFYCVSIWAAAILTPFAADGWPDLLVVWLAASGAACLLEQATASSPEPM